MPRRRYTREEILQSARELADEFGERLTIAIFTRETGISQHSIGAHFGKWSALRQAVGLRKRPPGETARDCVSREDLVSELQKLARETGGDVTLHEFCSRTGFGPATVYRQFGTWSGLRREAGLSARFRMPRLYSDDELMGDFERVVQLLDKVPTNAELNQLSRFSLGTYLRRFGNRSGIKQACVDYVDRRRAAQAAAGIPQALRRLIPANDPWVLDMWRKVRVSLLVYSSHLQQFQREWPELVVCLKHDWPECPCPVLELGTLLGDRLKVLLHHSRRGPKPRRCAR